MLALSETEFIPKSSAFISASILSDLPHARSQIDTNCTDPSGVYCFGFCVYRFGFSVYRFGFRLYRFRFTSTVSVSGCHETVGRQEEPQTP